jgi:hypothetical protein
MPPTLPRHPVTDGIDRRRVEMGMHYVPRRTGLEVFHLNWAGHELMARTLDLLGADLTSWSGNNDGCVVPAATCHAWAASLRNALEGNRVRLATVRGSLGREHDIPVIGGAATRGPGSLSADLELIDVAFGGDRFTGATPTFPIDAARRMLIGAFADFLAECGGCRQR